MGEQTDTGLPVATVIRGRSGGLRPLNAEADASALYRLSHNEERVLGWLCLMEARVAHKVIEIGYILFTPGMQRTTLATEVLYLAIRHVFEDIGYCRLEWTCTAENGRSRAAAERLGFVYEGTLRQGLILKGRPRDICMYSMLASEWSQNRTVLEAWLEPANFRDGRQVRPLSEIKAAGGPDRCGVLF